jgi:hypothetical protein
MTAIAVKALACWADAGVALFVMAEVLGAKQPGVFTDWFCLVDRRIVGGGARGVVVVTRMQGRQFKLGDQQDSPARTRNCQAGFARRERWG